MNSPAGRARRFPGLTVEQSARLRHALEARLNARAAGLPATGRLEAVEFLDDSPDADRSLLFALVYAIGCLRQDRPWLLYAGTVGLAYSCAALLQAAIRAATAAG